MSTTSLGAGWWEASDGRWYPPEAVPGSDPSPEDVRRSRRAVASLVCSCCGVIPLVGLVMTIVGIALGISARRQIRKSDGWLVGDGMARAGIVVGAVLLVLGIAGTAIGSPPATRAVTTTPTAATLPKVPKPPPRGTTQPTNGLGVFEVCIPIPLSVEGRHPGVDGTGAQHPIRPYRRRRRLHRSSP